MGIIKAVQELYCKSKSEFMRPDDGFKRDKKVHARFLRIMMPIFFCGKIKKVKFYDFEVPVPAKAEELLYLRYGKDWRIPKQKYESYTT